MTTLDYALAYMRAGFSLAPVLLDGTKKAAIPWKAYQARLAGRRELEHWFDHNQHGIAIICGKVSGGLEVIDFETEPVFLAWAELVESQAPGLLARFSQVQTPSGGRHIYYRTERPKGNHKLARTATGETLIETRGEGGYVVAPGSPLPCHPSGRPWLHVAGPALITVPGLEGLHS